MVKQCTHPCASAPELSFMAPRLLRLRLLALTAALASSGAALHAQRVRGQVLLSDSTTPAVGVIVLVNGPTGGTAGRALTSERGGFDIALPGPARYAVRVLRIGYKPTDLPPFIVAAAEVHELHIVLRTEAVSLAKVTVRSENSCRVRQDSGQLVARAWEEARKALTASQLSAGAPLEAEWIEFERTLDSAGRAVRHQTIRSTRSVTTHAFASLPGDSLEQVGYVIAEGGGARYFAPDADALLSESFAAVHCFHMEPAPPGESNLIGVGFRPAKDRDDVREIIGTFWLDRESAELRRLEFRYTGLNAVATDAGAGGSVQFLRLASGSWLIDRWMIRMPRLQATPGRVRNPFATVLTTGQPKVQAIEEAGGEVTLVLRGDSVVHRASGATLLARLVSRDSLVGIRGGTLTVDGTDYTAQGNASGVFRMTPVLSGHYRVRVSTADTDGMGAAPSEFDIDVRDGAPREATFILPPAAELLRSACGDQSVKRGEGQLRGTVRDPAGHPMAEAKVTVSWRSGFQSAPATTMASGAMGSGGIAVNTESRDVVTDGLGRWRICGVPRRTAVMVQLAGHAGAESPGAVAGAERPGMTASAESARVANQIRLADDQPFAEVALVAVATVAFDAPSSVTGMRPGLVDVSVTDRFGRPLVGAAVDIIAGGAALRPLRTDSVGHAQIAQVPSGRIQLRVRRIGYRAGDVAVVIEPGRNTVPVMLDKTAAPQLDTVRVRGDRRVTARLDEFETRRARGEASASIGREEIEKRHPQVVSQLLRNIPSIAIRDSLDKTGQMIRRVVSRRGTTGQLGLCYLRIMLDGIVLPDDTDIDQVLPSDIHGIEVFAGPANVPVKYGSFNGGWCGIVAIWSRDH
jgi:hypothetical protein